MEKVIKAFLSADILLCKLNYKHIKNLFHDICHSLPSETTCRNTVLQPSADESERIRNAVHLRQVFLAFDESTLSGIQYLNILFGSLEILNVSYLCDCQPSPCVPNSNCIT